MSLQKVTYLLFFCLYCNTSISQSQDIGLLYTNLANSKTPTEKVSSLTMLANFFKDKNLDSTKVYTEKLKIISDSLKLKKGMYNVNLLYAHINNKVGQDTLAIRNFDNAIKIAKQLNDNYLEGYAFYEKATYFYEKGDFLKTLKYNLITENSFSKTDSIFPLKIRNLNNIAFYNLELENYENALNYLDKIIKLTKNTKYLKEEVHAYSSIACVYSEINNHNDAFKYMEIAKEKSKALGDKNGELMLIHNTAILHYNKKEYTKAKSLFQTVINSTFSKREGNDIEAHLYLAKIDIENKNYETALKQLEYAEDISKKGFRKDLYLDVLFEKANLYYQSKQPNKALKLISQIVNLPTDNNLKDVFLLKSKIYNLLHKDKEELIAYKKHIALKEEFQNRNNIYNIESLKHSFEHRFVENEIAEHKRMLASLEERNQIKSKNNILTILIFTTILLFSIFSLFRYKKINRLNKERWHAEKIVEELKQEKLNFEVSSKQKQLTDFAIHITEKNDLLEKIKLQIIDTNIHNKNDAIKNLIISINNDIKRNKEKSQLYLNVEDGNDSFYEQLTKQYPNLTQKEKRIATLIRLGHTSKQISLQLNIAIVSVNNYRHSLRKKLKLTRDQNLIDFIKAI